jgi:hypothetical protein
MRTKAVQFTSLEDEVENLEQEGRMILPGIQALFGFQLIACFNAAFEQLSKQLQYIHLIALICVVISIVLVMTPPAFHRQAEPGMISTRFIEIGSKFLTISLIPLMIGVTLDVFVISNLISDSKNLSYAISGVTFALFAICWFIFPRFLRRRDPKEK